MPGERNKMKFNCNLDGITWTWGRDEVDARLILSRYVRCAREQADEREEGEGGGRDRGEIFRR